MTAGHVAHDTHTLMTKNGHSSCLVMLADPTLYMIRFDSICLMYIKHIESQVPVAPQDMSETYENVEFEWKKSFNAVLVQTWW